MKITLKNLGTKDLATFASRVISSSEKGDYTVVQNHELLAALKAEYTEYEKSYSKLTSSGKSAEIEELDKKRDLLFSALKSLLKGRAKLEGMPGSAEAAEIYTVVKNYGIDLHQLSYSAETAQLQKLLQELGGMTAKTDAAGVTEVVQSLKTAQDNFENRFSEVAELNAGLKETPSATAIRKRLEEALRNYLNLLTAMKNVDGWKMIYLEISELAKSAANSKATPPKPAAP